MHSSEREKKTEEEKKRGRERLVREDISTNQDKKSATYPRETAAQGAKRGPRAGKRRAGFRRVVPHRIDLRRKSCPTGKACSSKKHSLYALAESSFGSGQDQKPPP